MLYIYLNVIFLGLKLKNWSEKCELIYDEDKIRDK